MSEIDKGKNIERIGKILGETLQRTKTGLDSLAYALALVTKKGKEDCKHHNVSHTVSYGMFLEKGWGEEKVSSFKINLAKYKKYQGIAIPICNFFCLDCGKRLKESHY